MWIIGRGGTPPQESSTYIKAIKTDPHSPHPPPRCDGKAMTLDRPIPSCQEGLYLPQFVAPTPSDGERIVAEVQKELAIRIKAQARYSLIDNLIFSGPTNVTKHRLTHNEFEIRWTPVEDDLGDYYPICFAVESVKGGSIFASVTPATPSAALTGSPTALKIVAIIPLNGCGLRSRKHLVEARFYCQYPKRDNVTVSFSVHRKNIRVWEKGFGTFTYQFEFYQDDQFGAMFDPNSYPLEF
ncbi:hypothetical protein CRENBAI_005146 [Crenichthys baileyi]|uniref:Uncharacterized protein n=1 Tax=Crenichthys baileyi TaxID=28760 RepID=A0AAV9RGC8_9TELE